jgi:hypothetical protein
MNGRYLNEVAQGKRTVVAATATFDTLPDSERTAALSLLAFMAGQAKATSEDVQRALASLGFGADFQPVWTPLPGIILPLRENSTDPQQFRYLLALFSIADGRRREACAGKCGHWWHHLDEANESA